jgi:two-component system, LuxR family, sensor kinase FixL
MSWTPIAWSMAASACLTLAIVHLIIWCKQTDQLAHLLFSVTAISVAAIAALELLAMHAQSPEESQSGLIQRTGASTGCRRAR